MEKVERKVIVQISQTAGNEPYARVYYQNGTEPQPAHKLDKPTAYLANTIARNAVHNGLAGVLISLDTKKRVYSDDISILTDTNYCIAGSMPGEKNVQNVIDELTEATSKKEILTPLYIQSGTEFTYINMDAILRAYHPTFNNPQPERIKTLGKSWQQ